MNWIDAIVVIFALLGAYVGYKLGLVQVTFTLAGLLLGLVVAGHFYDDLALKFSSRGAEWASVIAFILILSLAVTIGYLVGVGVKTLLKLTPMGWWDTVAGVIIGLFAGGLAVAAVFAVVLLWEGSHHSVASGTLSWGARAIAGSRCVAFLISGFRLLLALLPANFDIVTRYF